MTPSSSWINDPDVFNFGNPEFSDPTRITPKETRKKNDQNEEKKSSRLPMLKLPVKSLKRRKQLIINRGPFKRGTTRSGKKYRGKKFSKKYSPNNIRKIMNSLSKYLNN